MAYCQNEINVISTDAICGNNRGSISLSLANPQNPQFPLPYIIELENRNNGVEVYFTMTGPTLELNNLDPKKYLVTVRFNQTCKLDIPIRILGKDDILETEILKPCGESKGKLSIKLNEVNFKPTWTYPFNGTLRNSTSNQITNFSMSNSDKEFDNLSSGDYEVSIVLSPACTLVSQIKIETDPFAKIVLNNASSSSYSPACKEENNGKLWVAVKELVGLSDITNNCTFTWSNGANKKFINNLAPGQYTVTATSIADPHCWTSKTFEVEKVDFYLTAERVNPSSCTTPNGSIKVKTSNNDFPYTYKWDIGQTTQEITGLSGGTYCVTVTHIQCDVVQCFDLKPLCCSNNLNIAATVTKGFEGGPNPPSGKIEVTMTGGSGNYNYEWSWSKTSFGPKAKLNLNGPVQSQLASGYYLIKVTDLTTGCEKEITTNIKNFVCKNELDKFFAYSKNFLVPLLTPTADQFDYCSLSKGRRLYIAWANFGNINVKLPLKIELIAPPGVKNVLDSIKFINTEEELKNMEGSLKSTINFQPLYRVNKPYQVKLTDGCGFTSFIKSYNAGLESIIMCDECQPPIYDTSDDNCHYIGLQYSGNSISEGDLVLKIKNPCDEGGNWIKLEGRPKRGFKFEITWPDNTKCTFENTTKDEDDKDGKLKYSVSKSQYNAKKPLKVIVKRLDANCVDTVLVEFNVGEKNLMFIPTDGALVDEVRNTYKGIETCNNCSAYQSGPSQYLYDYNCDKPVAKSKLIWNYNPYDKDNICAGGGTFVSDMIINGNIERRTIVVPPGTPIIDELDYYFNQPGTDEFKSCETGRTCVFDGHAIFGSPVYKKVMLRYCNLISEVENYSFVPCECPKSMKATTLEDHKIKLVFEGGGGRGDLEIRSPNGQYETLKGIHLFPPSTTYIFNTAGLIGEFEFTFKLKCGSKHCNESFTRINNSETGCPISFEITNFSYSPPKASILLNSAKAENAQLMIYKIGNPNPLYQKALFIAKGDNLLDFSCSNLKDGIEYEAKIIFINSMCKEVSKTFKVISSNDDCPSIDLKANSNTIDVTTSSNKEYIGFYKLLIFDVFGKIVKMENINIQNSLSEYLQFDISKLPKGDYTISIINKNGCPPVNLKWTKSFIVDPNPKDDCVLDKSVDLYFNNKTNEFIHTTSESFINSTSYTISSIEHSTMLTIKEFIRLSYDSLIVKHVRIDEYGNYIVVGTKTNNTYVIVITPDKIVKWSKTITDFIVSEVQFLSSGFEFTLLGTLTYNNVRTQIKINQYGQIINMGPIEYYDFRGGGSYIVDNLFLNKNNTISSFVKDTTTKVVVYNPSTKISLRLNLDPIITVKKIYRLESGEYFIAGEVHGVGKIADSTTYDYQYTSAVFIWTDSLLKITKTKIFDINETVRIKNVTTNGINKYLVVYTTTDTTYDTSLDIMKVTSCDQLYGFEGNGLQSRANKTNLDDETQNEMVSNNSELYVFPNPNKGNFRMRFFDDNFNKNGIYTLTNVDGTILHKENLQITKGENDITINNPSLKSGLYLIQIKLQNGNSLRAKVMIIE